MESLLREVVLQKQSDSCVVEGWRVGLSFLLGLFLIASPNDVGGPI